ncbi:MAG TPA: 3-deoxy-7-phosphoheptulonate synthase, partial [Armatimonadota bacterium]|nr:3-deoxy-7-phosphoheptulonate synthase [Armatimonadota bacterium]
MTTPNVYNLNIVSGTVLPTPREVMDRLPLTELLQERIAGYREELQRILDRQDPRLFVVVGPCSIHDTQAALEYAGRLHRLAEEVRETMLLVMRVYFEKPRTVVGWKGLINDPDLDGSYR